MNILLFGAPGAGKGTQSAKLSEQLKMRHISTGDLFRAAIKNQTGRGIEAKRYMDQGELVPDSVTIGMVGEELQKLAGQDFILDGFPRTVAQAEALEILVREHKITVGKALFLEVPQSELVQRLSGRRVCKGCGAVYHVVAAPSKKPGICDKCSGELVQRDDDKPQAIMKRLEVYEASTMPLKGFYKTLGKIVEINGTGSAELVFSRLLTALK